MQENTSRVTCCGQCGDPVIPTFLVDGNEFYCLQCRRFTEFFDDHTQVKDSAAIGNRYRHLLALFNEAVGEKPRSEAIAALRALTPEQIVS